MYKIYFNQNCLALGDAKDHPPQIHAMIPNPSVGEMEKILLELEKLNGAARTIFISGEREILFGRLARLCKIVEAAGGVVFNEKEEILLIKRLGFWDLPKGKIERGEDPGKCAIREVEEECHVFQLKIEKQLSPTFHTYNLKRRILKRTQWFRMRSMLYENAQPQLSEGIEGIKWVHFPGFDPDKLNTFPSVRDVLREASLHRAQMGNNPLHSG